MDTINLRTDTINQSINGYNQSENGYNQSINQYNPSTESIKRINQSINQCNESMRWIILMMDRKEIVTGRSWSVMAMQKENFSSLENQDNKNLHWPRRKWPISGPCEKKDFLEKFKWSAGLWQLVVRIPPWCRAVYRLELRPTFFGWPWRCAWRGERDIRCDWGWPLSRNTRQSPSPETPATRSWSTAPTPWTAGPRPSSRSTGRVSLRAPRGKIDGFWPRAEGPRPPRPARRRMCSWTWGRPGRRLRDWTATTHLQT